MNTLDFGEIMNDPNWFGQYDLRCPFCNCLKRSCYHCKGEEFEVMYNTAYEVNLKNDFEKSRKIAWELDFCLIKHGYDGYYLLLGGSGMDMSWLIHYARFKLQGKLHYEDMKNCFSAGTPSGLNKKQLKELCRYFRQNYVNQKYHKKAFDYDIHSLRCVLAKY